MATRVLLVILQVLNIKFTTFKIHTLILDIRGVIEILTLLFSFHRNTHT